MKRPTNSVASTSGEIAKQLIANGYAPIPIPRGHKGPRVSGWRSKIFTPTFFADDNNVGIRCGDSGTAFLDVDIYDPIKVEAVVAEWMNRFADRGEWMRRTGQAPKTGFLFRLPEAIKKTEVAVAPTGHAPAGKAEKVEVLCDGQQFIAFGIHPDTGQPYHWHDLDPLNTFLGVQEMLPEISEPELRDFLSWVAKAFGPEKPAQSLSERATTAISAPTGVWQPTHRTGDSAPFWRAVNDAALADLDAWVPALLPKAKKQSTGAWRVSSRDLGRNLEEDLSIHPNGIQDFGPEQACTAIDTVAQHLPTDPKGAAMWLCDRLSIDPQSLGWNEPPAAGGPMIATSTPQPDPDPVDLWGRFDPPELPRGLLPRAIEDFARENGDQMGADPAGLAVAALVTCAAAIPDAVQIKVKRHADWTESARLWAALIGPPSAKKSPIIAAATGPLCRLDVEMMRAWQKRVAEYEGLTAEEKKGRTRPPQTRLRIEDATVEAAQQVLEGSPWGVLLLQDELSGFFGAMDKYNGGKGAQADRAFWLRSFNGGQFALNRVARGASIIDNLSISMLGGIQPEPLRKVAGDSVDDGLLQRLFPVMLRNATIGRDEPMPPVNDEYRFLVEGLRKLSPPGFVGCGVLEFDDGAQRIRCELEAKHLELQSLETINRKLASHIGKYDGLFARLCVVWHCIEHVSGGMFCDSPDEAASDLPEIVTEATARRVADFLHGFLLAHAIGFYGGVLGLSDDHDRLTAIAGFILTHKLDRITNRDVQRGDRTMRGLRDNEIRPLLEQLDALGWLERMEPLRPSSPPHWRVNPIVHANFADRANREAARRAEARATIQQLVRS
jgi:hypothetical protein